MLQFFWAILVLIINISALNSQVTGEIIDGENTIHYKVFGEGSPLLIINGGPGFSSEGFIPLAKQLGKSNLAILYDQRGTGKSSISSIDTNTLTLELMVADIEALRQHLHIDRWTVLGHSFGGMLASYYSSKHPERINGIILSSSGGLDMTLLNNLNITSHLTDLQRDSLNYWSNQIAQGDTTYNAKYQRGRNLAPAYLHDQSFAEVIAHRLTQSNLTVNRFIWQNMRKINFDCKNELKHFNKPVLIIQGKEDIIPLEIAQLAHHTFTNSQISIMPACGHYGWLEQPEIYFNDINRFLNRLK